VAAGYAQGYPAKPIRMVIRFAPGGSLDTVGRLLAQQLSERLDITCCKGIRARNSLLVVKGCMPTIDFSTLKIMLDSPLQRHEDIIIIIIIIILIGTFCIDSSSVESVGLALS